MYANARYFCVTDATVEGFATVRHVDSETLAAIPAAMHAFAPEETKHKAKARARRERNRRRGPDPELDDLRLPAQEVARIVDPANAGNWQGHNLRIRCPCHHDSSPSLDLTNTPDGRLLAICRADCVAADVYARLRDILGERPSGEPRQANGHDEEPTTAGSEDALALELIAEHGHELRHVAELAQWFRWDGHHWAEDKTIELYDLARPIARRWARVVKGSGRKIASAATISGIERLARQNGTRSEGLAPLPMARSTPTASKPSVRRASNVQRAIFGRPSGGDTFACCSKGGC
jgi:D5-like protein